MTREQLKSYISMKAEIKELEDKIKFPDNEVMIGSSVINDYRSGYPVPQAVVGVDWDKVQRTENRYRKRIAELEKECRSIEDFIENISDSMTRRIFRMYYIEGIPQVLIGKAVHLDKSNVSRKIDNFLKIATHATNATL